MRKRFFAALRMTKWALKTAMLVVPFLLGSQRAQAQFITMDPSNLAQNVLAYLQDADNMIKNSEQFLINLGVAKEQLEFLHEADKRYREVRTDVYKAQSVIRMAKNYEQMAKMFVGYVDRITEMNGNELTYNKCRSMVNEGFQYLLFASREIKRAREYLDKKSQVSEEERMAQLADCDRRISRANAALYYHIRENYEDIDHSKAIVEGLHSLDEAFTIQY